MENNKEAIITNDLRNPTIAEWAKNQDAYLVSLGAPPEGLNPDLVIAEDREEAKGNEFELLRHSQFNRQQSWYKAGKPLQEWNGSGPFHLGNSLVMATWICGNRGAEGITFLNFDAEDVVTAEHDRRQFRDVMKKLIEEFKFGVRYTSPHSNLFAQLDATQFEPDPDPEPENVHSIDLPRSSELCSNEHSTIPTTGGIEVRQGGRYGAVGVAGGSTEIIVTEHVPESLSTADPSKLLLTYPAKEETVVRAVEFCENRHDIHLLDHSTKLEIYGLEREQGIENMSLSTTAVLVFAIGGNYEYIKTKGILENVGRKERTLLRGLAKGSHITHA